MKRFLNAVVFLLGAVVGSALNPAGVPDVMQREEKAARDYYRACVAQARHAFGAEWSQAIARCRTNTDRLRWRLIDLHK